MELSFKNLSAIVAHDYSYGIGYQNKLPWPYNKNDMNHFKDITMGKELIMGRKTFDSLPKMLPGRNHHIITRNPQSVLSKLDSNFMITSNNGVIQSEKMFIYKDKESILNTIKDTPYKDYIVIGGSEIYNMFAENISKFHITKVLGKYDCDTFLSAKVIFHLFTRLTIRSTIHLDGLISFIEHSEVTRNDVF